MEIQVGVIVFSERLGKAYSLMELSVNSPDVSISLPGEKHNGIEGHASICGYEIVGTQDLECLK